MSPPQDPNAGRIDHKTTDVLVKPFASLGNSENQRQALHGLVRVVSGQQIQDLQVLVGQMNVYVDMVGRLPTELVQEILSYLPLFQTYQAMRVSKDWLRILSDPFITQSSVRPWFADAKTPLRIPNVLSASAEAALKAEHIDAFQNGRPFSRLVVKRRQIRELRDSGLWAYVHGMVAWVPRNPKRCTIYHIATSFVKSWQVDRTRSVTELEISASIIAMVMDSGHCYVWKLTPKNRLLRSNRLSPATLQSRNIRNLVASESNLAILYEDSEDTTVTDITIWTLGGHAVILHAKAHPEITKALVSYPLKTIEKKILIDNASQSVVLFERVAGELCYTRFSFTNVLMARGHLASPHVRNLSTEMASPLSNGCAVIWSDSIAQMASNPETASCTPMTRFTHVVYDLRHDQLRRDLYLMDRPTDEAPRSFARSCFSFKNVMFYQHRFCDDTSIHVIDFNDMDRKKPEMGKPWTREAGCLGLQGDETYLVSMTDAGFCVWCFDKNITMAKEDQDFKEQMQAIRQKRLTESRMAD